MEVPKTEKEKEQLIKELTSKGYNLTEKNLPILNESINILSKVDDAISITEIVTYISSRSFLARLGSATSFISIILLPVSSFISILDALETGQRHYAMRAVAYTVTAWAFDDKIPTQSKRIINNLQEGRYQVDDETVQERHKTWRKTRERTLQIINRVAKENDISPDALKVVYRALGEDNREVLCLKILKGFEPQIYHTAKNIWKSTYDIKYPN